MSSKVERGRLVAATLAGAWRPTPPPLSISAAALAEIAPMLLQSGSAALAWWRLRHTAAAVSEPAAGFRDAYRYHSMEARLREPEILDAVAALRSVGIEPLLAKGWSVARLYPTPGLRPYSDIDLCIRPEQRARAEAALADRRPGSIAVDLHPRLLDMPDRSPDALHERACTVELGAVSVGVLGMEDHLRFLCLHLLRHGARRPLWLCDVGLIVESLPDDFDWDYCLSGEPRRSAWVVAVLDLTRRLLGARLDLPSIAAGARREHNWLAPTVLGQWGGRYLPQSSRLMRPALRRPDWLLAGLAERWPNPIEATYWLDGPVDARFRTRYQVRAFAERTISFLAGRPHGEH